jgi:cytochrome c556
MLSSLMILSLTGSMVQAQQPDTRTAEEKEYVYRDGLFNTIDFKRGKMIEAKMQGNQSAFKKNAADIATLAGLITDGFQIKGNIYENSLALPAIWEDFDNFTDKAANLQNTAQALANSGDMDALDPRKFGSGTCGACHRDHKKRVD